jgi:hypothetical protein
LAGFDPLGVIEVLNRHGVEYVVIGGFAAEVHDAAVPPTRDIDVTPRSSPENLARLSAALYELDAKVRADGVPEGLSFNHDATSLAQARVWNLTSLAGEFDITFQPSGTAGYDDLAVNAIHLAVYGQDLPVADLADLIRSKEAAGRPKDFSALPALHRRLAEQAGIPLVQRIAEMTKAAAARAGASPAPDPPSSPKC